MILKHIVDIQKDPQCSLGFPSHKFLILGPKGLQQGLWLFSAPLRGTHPGAAKQKQSTHVMKFVEGIRLFGVFACTSGMVLGTNEKVPRPASMQM